MTKMRTVRAGLLAAAVAAAIAAMPATAGSGKPKVCRGGVLHPVGTATAAYAAVKAALDHAATHDLASALAKEADLQDEAVRTSDHRSATEAFLRKEQPTFEGR